MKIAENHRFIVKGTSAPTIEVDLMFQAAYVRFRKARVAKTVGRPSQAMHLAVDLDESGEVIGIEAIGFSELRLDRLLKTAGVRTPAGMDLGKAAFRPVPSRV